MENQMQWRIREEFRNLSITVVNSVTKSLYHSISIIVIFFIFVLLLSYRELLLTVPVGYMRDLIWSISNVFVVVMFLWFSFTGISQSSTSRQSFTDGRKEDFYQKDDDAVVSSSKYHYRKWIQDTAGDGSKIFLETRDQGDRYKNGYLWDMIIGK